jgi:hypothetical protein
MVCAPWHPMEYARVPLSVTVTVTVTERHADHSYGHGHGPGNLFKHELQKSRGPALPPSCPHYYADLFRAPLHEAVLPKPSPPLCMKGIVHMFQLEHADNLRHRVCANTVYTLLHQLHVVLETLKYAGRAPFDHTNTVTVA